MLPTTIMTNLSLRVSFNILVLLKSTLGGNRSAFESTCQVLNFSLMFAVNFCFNGFGNVFYFQQFSVISFLLVTQ